jgi:hypothetical protein
MHVPMLVHAVHCLMQKGECSHHARSGELQADSHSDSYSRVAVRRLHLQSCHRGQDCAMIGGIRVDPEAVLECCGISESGPATDDVFFFRQRFSLFRHRMRFFATTDFLPSFSQ